MAVLELEDITAGRRGQEVLVGANLTIEDGGVYLLVGKPGAGKTSLLGIASGQAVPRSGNVRLYGCSYARHARRVGAVVDRPTFFTELTVRDNLMLRAISLGVPNAEDVVEETLVRYALQASAGVKVGALPAGSRAWLSLGWALIGSPDLLVLDDILLGLDPIDRSRMTAALRLLISETGISMLLAAREAVPLMSIATRIGVLANGRVGREYTPDELRRALRGRVRVRTSNIETTLARLEGELLGADIVLSDSGSLEIAGSSLDEVSKLLDRFPERIVELAEVGVLVEDLDYFGEEAPRC